MEWNDLPFSEKYARIAQMITVQHLTYSQISAQTGVSRSAVAGLVVRARRAGHDIPVSPLKARTILASPRRNPARKAPPRVPPKTRTSPPPERPAMSNKPTGKRPDFNYKPQFVAEEELAPSPPPRADAFLPLPGSEPVTLAQRIGCAWPVGEDPVLFCNEPLRPGSSWCKHHHALGFIPGSGRPPNLKKPVRLAVPARMTVLASDWDQ